MYHKTKKQINNINLEGPIICNILKINSLKIVGSKILY